MGRRTYTEEEKENAILVFARLNNLVKTSTETGINTSTLSRWMIENAEKVEQIRERTLEKQRKKYVERIVSLGLENSMLFQEQINEKLKKGQLHNIVEDKQVLDVGANEIAQKTSNYIGTMYDKYRLESGKSTENVGINLKELIDEVKGNEW